MTNRDFLINASALKNKQKEMLDAITEILDALNGLRQEAAAFSDIWEGEAEEAFFISFQKEWDSAEESIMEAGRLIEALVQAEREYEVCEKKVRAVMG